MRARIAFALAAMGALALGLVGCTSVGDTVFLVRKVDASAKSRAVTDEGIAVYELRVLGHQDYRAIEEARRYFEVALRFDPDNTRARQYLDTVDNFRESQLETKTAEASALLKKRTRSEDESYTMLLLVRQSMALAPADARAVALRGQTEPVRTALVKQLMDRTRVAYDQIKPEETGARREQKLLDVKDQYDRIHAIQPEYVELQLARSSLKGELDAIFASGSQAVVTRIDACRFIEACDEIDRLDALNRRLDNAHDENVRSLVYRLNYRWAKEAYEKGQLGVAESRIDTALRAKRTDEAASLKASITGKQRPAPVMAAAAPQGAAAAAAAAANEAGLREVQDLVRRGELVAANRRINGLLRGCDDRQTLAGLEEQQAAVRGNLPGIYARGVDAYKQEDFKRAVDLLSVVVEISVGYEQASDYLDKARAKQKLLEGLQGSRG